MAHPLPPSPVQLVLSRLKDVKKISGQWKALCPAHDDKEASLAVKVGKDDRAMLFCHAGCQPPAIVAAIGLRMTDLFVGGVAPRLEIAKASSPAQGVTTRPQLVKSYDYTDVDGKLVFQSCRFEPKSFRQRHKDATGDWVWNLNGISPVLYKLPDVLEAIASERCVYVVEGEKDADTLAEFGYVATTSAMGAGKWRESYSDFLAGSEVVILPDNDGAGRSHAEQVAASLYARDAAVKVVELPGLPEKGDVSDWFAADKAGNTVDAFEALIAKTPRWIPDPTKRTRWRLDEVWENDEMMAPPPPVVPYLAWASRSTLLAAREKSGKSTLTGYMAAQVSRGAEFLGEPCQRGHVLIIGLEEFIGDTARRLRHFNANGKMISLVDRFMSDPANRLDELTAHIEAVRPALVIVDSLVAYSQGLISEASNAMQTQNVVQGLTNLCHRSNVALVIIHHARKADGKYRDSSAIGGAVDIIAEVFPPEENTDPNLRRVRPIGRVPARPVDFRYDGHEYRLVDPSGATKTPVDQRILSVVGERPGISSNDVVNAVGDNRAAVLAMLAKLESNGLVLNDGTHHWAKWRLASFPKQGPI